MSIPAEEAMKRLVEGNKRYVESPEICFKNLHEARDKTKECQKPFAVVMGCSDSRVPLEIVFNQNIGDLFVIRVAGNVLNTDVIGSIEYAIKYLDVNLVMVMGHSECGVFKAAMSDEDFPYELKGVINKVREAVQSASRCEGNHLENSIKRNVRDIGRYLEEVCQRFVTPETGRKIEVVGGYYKIDTGEVEIIRDIHEGF